MDILAARKKAAEKAQSQKSEQVQPDERQTDVGGNSPGVGMPSSPPPAPVQEPQAAETAPIPAVAGAGAIENAGEPVETPVQEIEMLSFRLGGEEYAVMVDNVREVLKRRELTIVPNAPDYILGVISLRGAMIPVIDLCKRLGFDPGVRDEKSRIIIVSPDEEDAGLIVDRVTGVHRFMDDAIKPVPENIEHGGEFLRGIVRKDDKLFIVLDLVRAMGRENA